MDFSGIFNNDNPIASAPAWLYIGAALLIGTTLWLFKKLILVAITLALGGLTYVSYGMGHQVDKITVGFGIATIVSAVLVYFVFKHKAAPEAPAEPAPTTRRARRKAHA